MWKKGIRVIVSFAVVLLVWQIACTVTNANATLFPSPVKVGEEFVKLFTQGLEGSTSHVTLPGHIRISLLRFATGYVLAAVSAILLGLILGSLPKVFQFINPILQIIRPIAPVAFLPFIVFWFGIGDVPAIVIIFIAGFFPILLSVVAAVQHVDGIYYKIANSFGVGKVKTLFGIVFPAIFTALSVLGSVAGTLLSFYMVFQGAYNLLTPLALLVFLLLWALPVLLLADWAGRY